MTVTKKLNGTELTVEVEGRLDTNTAPQLEGELKDAVDGITKVVIDLANLEYISSAGLRVLLALQKVMSKQGELVVVNANADIIEIFEITGFVDILNIQ